MRVTVSLHCDGPGLPFPDCTNALSAAWEGDPDNVESLPLAMVSMATDGAAEGWERRPVGTPEGEKVIILCPTCRDALAGWAAANLTSGEEDSEAFDSKTPPLDLAAIEDRLARRTPEETAMRMGRLDQWERDRARQADDEDE